MPVLTTQLPSAVPLANPDGTPVNAWAQWFLTIQSRTGGSGGVDAMAVQLAAQQAGTAAAAAQASANAAAASANGKVSKAGDTMTGLLVLSGPPTSGLNPTTKMYTDAADSANTVLINNETIRAEAAEALAMPKTGGSFSGGIGVWGHAAPGSQPATPVTLSDVIALIRAYGLSA